jgi:hypothetical protein
LFQHFETAKCSIKSLAAQFLREGRTLRGRRINASLVHQILLNRLYMGEFNWDGIPYSGTHEPVVSLACCESVQELLDARVENKPGGSSTILRSPVWSIAVIAGATLSVN